MFTEPSHINVPDWYFLNSFAFFGVIYIYLRLSIIFKSYISVTKKKAANVSMRLSDKIDEEIIMTVLRLFLLTVCQLVKIYKNDKITPV